MEKQLIISYEEMDSIILRLREKINRISDILDKQNNNFERINATDIWSGNAQSACYSKHIEMNAQFRTIIDSLNKYANFLESVKQAYIDLDAAQNRVIDSNF